MVEGGGVPRPCHLLHGRELRFTTEEILSGKPRDLALQLPPPYSLALEKALGRHVAFRTENAKWNCGATSTRLLPFRNQPSKRLIVRQSNSLPPLQGGEAPNFGGH